MSPAESALSRARSVVHDLEVLIATGVDDADLNAIAQLLWWLRRFPIAMLQMVAQSASHRAAQREKWLAVLKAEAETAGFRDHVQRRVEERDLARKAKQWLQADLIRQELAGYGIKVEDGADGSKWRFDYA